MGCTFCFQEAWLPPRIYPHCLPPPDYADKNAGRRVDRSKAIEEGGKFIGELKRRSTAAVVTGRATKKRGRIFVIQNRLLLQMLSVLAYRKVSQDQDEGQ